MKSIKISILHPCEMEIRNILFNYEENLEKEFEVLLTQKDPSYIVASEHIYSNKKTKKNFMSLCQSSAIKVFFAGECISPDMNVFDYALVFDKNLHMNDRIIRVPTLQFFRPGINDFDVQKPNIADILAEKKFFCNFIYSNPYAHPNRDLLFQKIHSYKNVDSLGKHLNNKKMPDISANNWQEQSILAKVPYKFSIASENAQFNGYTSEKLLTSFEANTIPIYWGNPLVSEDFNSEAFINCHDYSNFDEVVKAVKRVDESDDLYLEMLAQPRRTAQQIEQYQLDMECYKNFIKNIFTQDIHAAARIPQGFHPDNYRRWLFNKKYYTFNLKDITWEKIIRKIKRYFK